MEDLRNVYDDNARGARERDPAGVYRLVSDDALEGLEANTYDVVLSAFTFDNIPTMERKVALFRSRSGS